MNRQKLIFPIVYLLGWVALYFLPPRFYYDPLASWFIPFSFSTVLPFFLYYSLRKFEISSESAQAGALVSIVLSAGVYIFFVNKKSTDELLKYGKETRGFIYKSYNVKQRKSKSIWSVQAMYIVENESYRTELESDREQILHRGDTVTIIYSSRNPYLSEIKELEEYYQKAD